MKAIIVSLMTFLVIGTSVETSVSVKASSSNSKSFLKIRNNSDQTKTCFLKTRSKTMASRTIASESFIVLSPFESKKVTFESNDGLVTIEDFKIDCQKLK